MQYRNVPWPSRRLQLLRQLQLPSLIFSAILDGACGPQRVQGHPSCAPWICKKACKAPGASKPRPGSFRRVRPCFHDKPSTTKQGLAPKPSEHRLLNLLCTCSESVGFALSEDHFDSVPAVSWKAFQGHSGRMEPLRIRLPRGRRHLQ